MSFNNITIEEYLKQVSISQPEFSELWSTWNLNKQTLDPILNAIIKDYPHYSFHDASHSESILLNIERVLGTDNLKKLSPTDLWVLLHVAYLHDLGMVIKDTKLYDVWKSAEFQSFLLEQCNNTDEDIKKAANIITKLHNEYDNYDSTWPLDVKKAVTLLISVYCRSKHAEYSREYIIDIKNIWGIDLGHNGLVKNRLISLIGDISNIHTKEFIDVLSLHKESNGFKNDYVHPRLIACLLRLGDVLDLDNGRFNTYGEEIFGRRPENSTYHYEKHESTKHVLVTNEIIELEADCKTDAVYRETRRWFDSVEHELDNLRLSWNDIAPVEFGRPPKLASKKILRNGVEDINGLSNLKFSISQKKSFELLEGSSIYKDKFSCLREIIQNAEDASKIQMWRDIKSGMYYHPGGIEKEKVETGTLFPDDIQSWIYQIYTINIEIEKDEKNDAIVTISDHGTGITISTLKEMCNVGESGSQKGNFRKEIAEMPEWLRPTANFGIGLQSCFMATNKFTVLTNSYDDGGLRIIFETGKDQGYINVESSSELIGRGSKVIITFINEMNFSMDMLGFTAKNLAYIEPFKSHCVVIYRIIESLFKECGSSFFDIVVKSKEIDFQQTIPSYNTIENNKTLIPHESIAGCKYQFDDNFSKFTCWYNNTYFTLRFTSAHQQRLETLFKGKTVKNNVYSNHYVGFNITADIYSMDTKEALSLNREKLTPVANKKLSKDIVEVIKIFFDLLYDNSSEIQRNSKIIDLYYLSSWIYEKKFPDRLIEGLSTDAKFRVLQNKGGKYTISDISVKELSESYPNIPYLNNEVSESRVFADGLYSLNDLIQVLDRHKDVIKDGFIIVDDKLRDFLKVVPSDKTFIDTNNAEKEDICICQVNITGELYIPDPYTESVLIKKLVHDTLNQKFRASIFSMRLAIPAFKKYEKLATELEAGLFVGVEHYAKWYIISPIASSDYPKISQMTEEAFVENIVSSDIFMNIVEYVKKNNMDKKVTQQNIIDDYRKLISEYYRIAKNIF